NRFVSSAQGLAATWYHKRVGQWVLATLVVVHVAAILYYLFRKKDNLIGPMLRGDKQVAGNPAPSRDDAKSRLAALLVFGLCVAFVVWLVTLGGAR
ncbi:MAG: cytochrome B, partial [Ramlibacter sp.]